MDSSILSRLKPEIVFYWKSGTTLFRRLKLSVIAFPRVKEKRYCVNIKQEVVEI
jgi:hypothetical protein